MLAVNDAVADIHRTARNVVDPAARIADRIGPRRGREAHGDPGFIQEPLPRVPVDDRDLTQLDGIDLGERIDERATKIWLGVLSPRLAAIPVT